MKGFFWLVAVFGFFAGWSFHARGDDDVPSRAKTVADYDAVGRLMRNEDAGLDPRSSPFVLVDKDGEARCSIISKTGSDLSALLGQRVGVRGSVRFVPGDPLPLIAVTTVQPLGGQAVPPASPAARQVQHQEPTPAELPMPQPEVNEAEGGDGSLVLEPTPAVPAVDSFPSAIEPDLGKLEPGQLELPQGPCDCEKCGGTSCTTCSECCLANDPGQWYGRLEYLLWGTKGMFIPPLATTGPGASNPGILGQPGTVILFGNEAINGDMRSGGRITLGTWLDEGQTWGLSGEYFGLADAGESFFAASNANGVPTISRPYFTIYGIDGSGDLKPAGQNAELVALEGVLSGSLGVETYTSLQGGGLFLRRTFCCKNMCWDSCDASCTDCTTSCTDAGTTGVPGGVRVGMFGGYRFMLLGDGVSITEDLTAISTSPADQGQFLINDKFNSNNQFHGGELGFITEARRERWTFELLSRLAIGNNYQTVQIDGSTVISGSQQDDGTYQGGLLALPTNIGSYSRNQLSVIPQLNANIGYNLTPRLRAIVGYTFLYWGNVARAGEQISLDVNETYIPAGFATPQGPRRPAFIWQPNDFWAQGLNLGLDYFW
jgi:hypothetical protein